MPISSQAFTTGQASRTTLNSAHDVDENISTDEPPKHPLQPWVRRLDRHLVPIPQTTLQSGEHAVNLQRAARLQSAVNISHRHGIASPNVRASPSDYPLCLRDPHPILQSELHARRSIAGLFNDCGGKATSLSRRLSTSATSGSQVPRFPIPGRFPTPVNAADRSQFRTGLLPTPRCPPFGTGSAASHLPVCPMASCSGDTQAKFPILEISFSTPVMSETPSDIPAYAEGQPGSSAVLPKSSSTSSTSFDFEDPLSLQPTSPKSVTRGCVAMSTVRYYDSSNLPQHERRAKLWQPKRADLRRAMYVEQLLNTSNNWPNNEPADSVTDPGADSQDSYKGSPKRSAKSQRKESNLNPQLPPVPDVETSMDLQSKKVNNAHMKEKKSSTHGFRQRSVIRQRSASVDGPKEEKKSITYGLRKQSTHRQASMSVDPSMEEVDTGEDEEPQKKRPSIKSLMRQLMTIGMIANEFHGHAQMIDSDQLQAALSPVEAMKAAAMIFGKDEEGDEADEDEDVVLMMMGSLLGGESSTVQAKETVIKPTLPPSRVNLADRPPPTKIVRRGASEVKAPSEVWKSSGGQTAFSSTHPTTSTSPHSSGQHPLQVAQIRHAAPPPQPQPLLKDPALDFVLKAAVAGDVDSQHAPHQDHHQQQRRRISTTRRPSHVPAPLVSEPAHQKVVKIPPIRLRMTCPSPDPNQLSFRTCNLDLNHVQVKNMLDAQLGAIVSLKHEPEYIQVSGGARLPLSVMWIFKMADTHVTTITKICKAGIIGYDGEAIRIRKRDDIFREEQRAYTIVSQIKQEQQIRMRAKKRGGK